MSYTVSRESLLRAVKLATSIIPRHSPKTALKGVLLKAERDCLVVKSTDMETAGIEVRVPTEGESRDWWYALPDASRLDGVLTEANATTLNLSKENDSLFLTSDFSETVLQDCDNPDAYPSVVLSEAKAEDTLIINAGKLATSLKRIVQYCSNESARYALTGVKFERADGKLTLVATDGKWMAVQDLVCVTCTASDAVTVVPEKAIRTLLAAMRGEEGEVTIGFAGNYVTFTVDGVTLSARMVEGRYPTYREVFPKKHSIKLPLNAGSLLAITRQAAVMTTQETKGIDYTLDTGKLTAKSSDPVAGRAKVELPIAYDGKAHSITFDGNLVAKMLAQWDGSTELEACLVEKNIVAEFRFPESFTAVIVPLSKKGDGK